MNCRYCGALNSEYDHRCVRCGRRTYLANPSANEALPFRGNVATAPVIQGEARYQAREQRPAVPQEPQQASLFQSGDALRVVQMPASGRRDTVLRPAPGGTGSRQTGAFQQRLSFPSTDAGRGSPQDSTIYCDAPVALPIHRLMAAALDGSMILISMGIFVTVLYLAGEKVILNKTTMPYYLVAIFATMTLYRLLWCTANMDSIGMRWTGLRLITFDGIVPDRKERMRRFITSYISTIAGGLGLLWGLVDEEKLTWHDHMSKTFPTPRTRRLKYPPR
jgi:uncharacterized RDD family membrane protein YckC